MSNKNYISKELRKLLLDLVTSVNKEYPWEINQNNGELQCKSCNIFISHGVKRPHKPTCLYAKAKEITKRLRKK